MHCADSRESVPDMEYVQRHIIAAMADPLYDLLAPYFEPAVNASSTPVLYDSDTASYINRLSSLPLSSLTNTEVQSPAQTHHSLLLSLQGLSTRSYRSII